MKEMPVATAKDLSLHVLPRNRVPERHSFLQKQFETDYSVATVFFNQLFHFIADCKCQ